MEEQAETARPRPSQGSGDEARRSKLLVVGMVIMILAGWAAWTAWDYLGTEGLNPKKIKRMAKYYEGQCFRETKARRFCKRHIGQRHRACLPSGIDRAKPGEAKRPLKYDREGYSACMTRYRADDWAVYQRKAGRGATR